MSERKKVFVIMPFEDEFFETYELLRAEFSQDYEFSNASDEGNQQNILKDIIEPLYYADIVIADLTGLNPNVMYELGIAHTFNKKTIVITRDALSDLPFDLKLYRAKDYSKQYTKFRELIDYLRSNMEGASTGEVSYGNPVKDFMDWSKMESTDWFCKEPVKPEEDTDAGFLDFLTEIEENAVLLTEDINQMSTDMQTMADGISNCAKEIERVNENGGSGTASYARKKAKKMAEFIDDFTSKLHAHNDAIEKFWDKIEKNSIGLIENKYATSDGNGNSLINYLNSLRGMQNSIVQNNQAFEDMKKTLNNIIGIERSMNQAVRLLNEDLSDYLDKTINISLSIDKILEKSRYVVGEI